MPFCGHRSALAALLGDRHGGGLRGGDFLWWTRTRWFVSLPSDAPGGAGSCHCRLSCDVAILPSGGLLGLT